MQRILVIRGGAVGDLILTLPALRALRSAFPSARIDVMGDANRANLACHPAHADAIIDAEQQEIYRLFSHEPRVPKQLAAYLSEFDLILSYLPAPHSPFVDNLKRCCSGEVIAWPPHPTCGTHVADHLTTPVLRYARQGLPPEPRFFPTMEQLRVAGQYWRAARLPERGVLAVHPGSGGRYKLWPLEGWQQVAAWAVQKGVPGLLICGPAEEERGVTQTLHAAAPAWRVILNAPLTELAAILARCEVLVGHDTGIVHLAAAVGTRTLALYGPTDPRVWGPRSRQCCVIQTAAQEPLSLENMPVDTVIRTLRALLNGTFRFDPSELGHTRLRGPA